jgi:hypothetical protein
MLKKSSVFMMVLLVAASLIGTSSIYQYEERQVLPAATAQSQQQLSPNVLGNVLVGKIAAFKYYSSSDGKACTVFAQITEGTARIYSPNNIPFPFGLKLGDRIILVVQDQTMCVLLGQANIAKMDFQFFVALPPVTAKALPPGIQKYFPPSIYPRLYRVVEVNIPFT